MRLEEIIEELKEEIGEEEVKNLEVYAFWFGEFESEILGIEKDDPDYEHLLKTRKSIYLRYSYAVIQTLRRMGLNQRIKMPIKTREQIREDVYKVYNVEEE